jgi:hypothetical protein
MNPMQRQRRRSQAWLNIWWVGNPARRLYERLGFREIPGSAVTSRAGGMSIGMELALKTGH